MSVPRYSIETRSQAALILGEGSGLTPPLLSELKKRGIYALAITSAAELHALLQTHDLDYLFLLSPFIIPPELVATLQSQLQSGITHLVVLHHVSESLPTLPLTPIHLELSHCDYLGVDPYFSPQLQTWAHSLTTTRTLVVPGDGLTELGLLDAPDLVTGVVTCATSPHPPGHQLLLTSVDSVSLLNLAYDLRSLLPYKIHLSFDSAATPPITPNALAWPRFSWPQSSQFGSLLSRFAHTLPTTFTAPPSPAKIEKVAPPKLTRLSYPTPVFTPLSPPKRPLSLSPLLARFHRPKASHPPRLRHIVARGLLIALALYLGSLAFAATIAGLSLRQLAVNQGTSALPTVSPLTAPAVTYLEANLFAASLVPGISNIPAVSDSLLLLDAYHQLLTSLSTARELSTTTGQLMGVIMGEGEGDLVQLISQSRLTSASLYQQLSLLDGTLPAQPPPTVPARYRDNYSAAKADLASFKRSALMTKALLSTLPDLIGLGGRRKYGVLFQNNMELRPTGGFIGSFAILSFDNGTLYDMPVYDVYQADGQLKGHVEPPVPIKDILGEANWFLRDSNFDPDFPTSARRAEWFIQKTLNQTLDGTIAINLHTLSGLLQATGPLDLADYQETVNADNLYERAQYHAEVNFFPGSTQKKEFLSAVANALFTQLSNLPESSALPVASSLLHSIEEKNTLLSVVNPATDHVLSTLNWNGAISPQPDSTMVVDSNFGVNKANYFLRRDTQVVITLAKDLSFNHVLRLRYSNTSTSNSWPAGAYKNYSRFYLPANSLIRQFKVGEKTLTPSDYTATSEHGKTVVGYLMTVPINSTVGVELEYQVPGKLTGESPTYSWYWQKQPGTGSSEPLTVYLNYPLYLKPQVISPAAELGIQQLQFNLKNDTDHRLSVNFTQ